MWNIILDLFSDVYFVGIILALGILYLHFLPRINKIGYKLPPGPTGIPFLGYHPFLGSHPELTLEKLRNKYGNVLGLYIGSQYCVVISDFESVKEAYNQKAFLGRPPLFFRTSPEHPNFAEMSEYSIWLRHRSFTVNTLKELGMGKNRLEELATHEVSHFITQMSKNVGKGNVCVRELLTPAINNGIIQLICGKSLDDDEPLMKQLIDFEDLGSESYLNTSPIYWYPWLRPFILRFDSRLKTIMECAKGMEDFVREEIKQHEANFDENNLTDYIDYFILEMRKSNAHPSFTKDMLRTNSMFLLLAGSDTVRNTLEWCMLSMIKFPEIQEKVYEEIRAVIGEDIRPTWNDKINLPYTEAVIMEAERWRTLTVLNCLRMTTEDTTLKGYDIPKGTYVMNNIWACHMNPAEWKDPEVFNPERFLSKDGTKAILPQNLILFSFGRRDCPGDKMARMEVFLYFSALMQKFKFVTPDRGLDLSCTIRINAQANNPVVKFYNRA